MSAGVAWALIAAVFLIVEMMTGTFFLAVWGAGAAAGALVAWGGAAMDIQMILAGLVGLIGTAALLKFRPQLQSPDARANPDVNPDIGQKVRIAEIASDGTLKVDYRGAPWKAQLKGALPETTRDYVIARVEGNTLILEPLKD